MKDFLWMYWLLGINVFLIGKGAFLMIRYARKSPKKIFTKWNGKDPFILGFIMIILGLGLSFWPVWSIMFLNYGLR